MATSYWNHAGTSWPKPEPVRAAAAVALAADPQDWPAALARDHAAVAAAFGIVDPDRLRITPGATAALRLAVAGLPWRDGDRVLTSSREHAALSGPVAELRHRGVTWTQVPGAGAAPLCLDALERELAAGGVRLVAMTAACNVSGALLPIEEVVALAHRFGALCLVDAAQLAGWIDLDVPALDVDLLAFAGHKGPQGPWGVGGLYVAPAVACGEAGDGGAVCAVDPLRAAAPMPGFCEAGSIDRAALAGTAAGLAWMRARPERLVRARRSIARIEAALAERPGLRRHGAVEIARRMPTLAFTVAGASPAEVAARCAAEGIHVSGGQQCAPLAHASLGTLPDGVVRISVGPEMADAAIDPGIAGLRRALDALSISSGP